MSTLISSAVSGTKAAPKGAPRRRQAAPPPTPPAPETSTPTPLPSAPASLAPPSPTPTQHPDTTASTSAQPQALQVEPPQATDQGRTDAASTPNQPVAEIGREGEGRVIPSSGQGGARQIPPAVHHPTATATATTQPRVTQTTPPVPAQKDATPAPRPPKRKARVDAPSKPPAAPNKRVKRSSARSHAVVQAQIHEDDAPHPTTRRDSHGGKGAAPETAAGTAPPHPRASARGKKTRPTRKSAATVVNSDDEGEYRGEATAEADEREAAVEQPRRTKRRTATPKAKPRRGRRKATKTATPPAEGQDPHDGTQGEAAAEDGDEEDDGEDASDGEQHPIDPNTMTMYGLSYDRRHGKTSEREKKMAEIDWEEVARKRYQELEAAAALAASGAQSNQPADIRETTEGPSGIDESRTPPNPSPNGVAPDPSASAEPDAPSPKPIPAATDTNADDAAAPDTGPGFRIVNGQIVTDDSTLVIDRLAQAEVAAASSAEAIVEDNDLTRRVNQMSWVHARRRDVADRVPHARGKSDPWTEEETERFYDALTMFGTDFFLISKMFVPKTRKMIKLKFIREERLDLKRVNAALLGQKTAGASYNLEFYARETGTDVNEFRKYEDVEDAERVIRESMREREKAMQEALREEEAAEEALRQAEGTRERGKKRMAAERKAAGGRKKKGAGGGIGGDDGDGGEEG